MSRFAISTALTVLVLGTSAIGLPVSWRLPVAAAATLLYLVAVGCGVAFIGLNFFLPALCRGPGDRREIALSFDDGPDPESTPALLDLLGEHDVRATFFCVGERVREYPEIARRIVNEGHLLGNHSQYHGWWINFLFGRALDSELDRAQQTIESVTGVRPRYYRPPLGLTNPHYRRALGRAGLRLVGWHVRSFDLRAVPVESIVRRVSSRARPGSIIALHDAGPGRQRVLDLARALIASTRAQGYSLVRVDRFDEGAAACIESSQNRRFS